MFHNSAHAFLCFNALYQCLYLSMLDYFGGLWRCTMAAMARHYFMRGSLAHCVNVALGVLDRRWSETLRRIAETV